MFVTNIQICDTILTCFGGLSNLLDTRSRTDGENGLDDLIYSFLLKLDYPRESIVFDVDLLGPTPQIGSGMKVPAFVIVDPDTADVLAVIEVVDAYAAEDLKDAATETGAYASRLAGNLIQGFVIRVDIHAAAKEEKVKFYRIWPNSTLKQLSARNFPNFDSLRVSRKLATKSAAKALEQAIPASGKFFTSTKPSHNDKLRPSIAGLYLPALALLLLIVADALLSSLYGLYLLTLPGSILASVAAALMTLPAAIRHLRD